MKPLIQKVQLFVMQIAPCSVAGCGLGHRQTQTQTLTVLLSPEEVSPSPVVSLLRTPGSPGPRLILSKSMTIMFVKDREMLIFKNFFSFCFGLTYLPTLLKDSPETSPASSNVVIFRDGGHNQKYIYLYHVVNRYNQLLIS